jgi:hypothetical protein
MKFYMKIAAFLITAGVAIFLVLMMKEASKSESLIIAGERKKLADSIDKNRAAKDPAYSRNVEEKLRFLDYRLAIAFNTEKRPDQAIAVLNKLISSEEAKSQHGLPRRARSYYNEAEYYEVLIESLEIKKDEAGVREAERNRDELQRMASGLKKLEERAEGRSVGLGNAQ